MLQFADYILLGQASVFHGRCFPPLRLCNELHACFDGELSFVTADGQHISYTHGRTFRFRLKAPPHGNSRPRVLPWRPLCNRSVLMVSNRSKQFFWFPESSDNKAFTKEDPDAGRRKHCCFWAVIARTAGFQRLAVECPGAANAYHDDDTLELSSGSTDDEEEDVKPPCRDRVVISLTEVGIGIGL